MAKKPIKFTPVQRELLGLLARGPRYGFTNLRCINSLVAKGLARKVKSDWIITAAGKRLLPPPRKHDQSTSWNTPGFVEAFRIVT